MRNVTLLILLAALPGAPATVDLTWFTSQAEFEAFVHDQRNFLTGIEDYEESTLPPSSAVGIPDPLEPGVPNGPFPNGMEGVDNMIVQANILGSAPESPAPHSPAFPDEDGLAAGSVGDLGFQSDVVLSNYANDSHDLILHDHDITAIGFDIIAFNGPNVDVRVFDIGNNFLGMVNSPGDHIGTHFVGVWSTAQIGRINIHDPDDDNLNFEGADNIQVWAWCGECPTDVDGSGDTGPFDLAFLLGFWGPCAPSEPCACLDADDDGLLGPADLAVLLGAWGPCE